MIPSYRDPDKVLEETRQMVAAKLLSRKEKRQALYNKWGKVIVYSCAFIFVAGLAGLASTGSTNASLNLRAEHERELADEKVRHNKAIKDWNTGPCSLFANKKMVDIPARCLDYFQHPNGGK